MRLKSPNTVSLCRGGGHYLGVQLVQSLLLMESGVIPNVGHLVVLLPLQALSLWLGADQIMMYSPSTALESHSASPSSPSGGLGCQCGPLHIPCACRQPLEGSYRGDKPCRGHYFYLLALYNFYRENSVVKVLPLFCCLFLQLRACEHLKVPKQKLFCFYYII